MNIICVEEKRYGSSGVPRVVCAVTRRERTFARQFALNEARRPNGSLPFFSFSFLPARIFLLFLPRLSPSVGYHSLTRYTTIPWHDVQRRACTGQLHEKKKEKEKFHSTENTENSRARLLASSRLYRSPPRVVVTGKTEKLA